MVSETPVFLQLTPEEITVLYEHLVPSPSVLPYDDLLPQYSEEQRVLALDVARRGLVARLLLDPGREGIERLNPVALAIAGSTLLAQRTLRILRQTSTSETQTIDFYKLDETTHLMHTIADERLQQFVLLSNPRDYQEAIFSGLDLEALGEADDLEIILDSDLFNNAVTQAQSGIAVAVQKLLAEAELPNEVADRLIATLSGTFEFKTIISSASGEGIRSTDQSLTFLSSAGVMWLVDRKVDSQSNNRLHIRLLNDATMHRIIQAFLNLQE
jgi:hypothetical protein